MKVNYPKCIPGAVPVQMPSALKNPPKRDTYAPWLIKQPNSTQSPKK